jgi:hypothetical protein
MPEPSGRPSKLTADVRDKVVNAIRLGGSRNDAALFAGIDPRTLRRWMDAGAEEGDGPHAELRAAVVEAETIWKVTALGTIAKAASTDWKAAAWLLERRHPAEFGDKSVLFLVKHALAEMEKAAEQAGVALPENAWEQAWATVARQLAQKLPEAVAGIGPGAAGDFEGFESEEDLDLALKLLGRRRSGGNGSPS